MFGFSPIMMGSAGSVSAEFIGQYADTTLSSTHTFNVSLGEASSDRIILVFLSAAITALHDPTVSIAGVAATTLVPIFTHNVENGYQYGMAVGAEIPSGSSGTVVLNWGATFPGAAISVVRLSGTDGLSPFDTATDTAGTLNMSIDCPRGGAVVGLVDGSTWTGTPGWNWSGLTEVYDANSGIGSTQTGIAISQFLFAQSGLSVAASPVGTPTRSVGTLLSWRPK